MWLVQGCSARRETQSPDFPVSCLFLTSKFWIHRYSAWGQGEDQIMSRRFFLGIAISRRKVSGNHFSLFWARLQPGRPGRGWLPLAAQDNAQGLRSGVPGHKGGSGPWRAVYPASVTCASHHPVLPSLSLLSIRPLYQGPPGLMCLCGPKPHHILPHLSQPHPPR